ncbi:MAG: hypothetical protein WD771_06395 [Gemmatimonadaceae bacterium]
MGSSIILVGVREVPAPTPDGKRQFVAEDPHVPGAIGYGATADEALQMLHVVRKSLTAGAPDPAEFSQTSPMFAPDSIKAQIGRPWDLQLI